MLVLWKSNSHDDALKSYGIVITRRIVMKIIRKSALGLAVIALSAGIFSGSALADVQTQGISDNEIRIGAFGPFG